MFWYSSYCGELSKGSSLLYSGLSWTPACFATSCICLNMFSMLCLSSCVDCDLASNILA